MAVLTKQTIQRLAVLRALSMWRRGAYGPMRLHKTLFFADKDAPAPWRLFTFKKWLLGQYSDEIADALNALREAGTISTSYDGPSERLKVEVTTDTRRQLADFFRMYFPVSWFTVNWNSWRPGLADT